jgi:hypothetical protein
MHLFDDKKGFLRPKNGPVFKLMPHLPALCLGPTPALWTSTVEHWIKKAFLDRKWVLPDIEKIS